MTTTKITSPTVVQHTVSVPSAKNIFSNRISDPHETIVSRKSTPLLTVADILNSDNRVDRSSFRYGLNRDLSISNCAPVQRIEADSNARDLYEIFLVYLCIILFFSDSLNHGGKLLKPSRSNSGLLLVAPSFKPTVQYLRS